MDEHRPPHKSGEYEKAEKVKEYPPVKSVSGTLISGAQLGIVVHKDTRLSVIEELEERYSLSLVSVSFSDNKASVHMEIVE